jgi:hypothetical protein
LIPCFSFSGVIDSKGNLYEVVNYYYDGPYYIVKIDGISGSKILMWVLGDDPEVGVNAVRIYLSPKDDVFVLYYQMTYLGDWRGSNDEWILSKLNTARGALDWSRQIEASYDNIDVYFDKQGNIYLVGFGNCFYAGKFNRKTGKPIWEGCVDIGE